MIGECQVTPITADFRPHRSVTHLKPLITLLVGILVPTAISVADEARGIDRLDRVACIESQVPSQPNTRKLCSVFVVSAGARLFLVTAGHACAETSGESRLRYRDARGGSQWVTLRSLVPKSSNPWRRDPTSDFAIAEIHSREGNEVYLSHLDGLSIPLESLSSDTPRRTTPIVTIGFPLGMGIQDEVSPLAVVGHIASRETLAESRWGNEPVVFCTPPLAQGTSGGPAFLASEANESLTVIGMYIGVIRDSTGAKLSKMVPAHLIRKSIKSMIAESSVD